ncbi:MAG: primosomal protein N' [Hydrogenibacillus sp.]|nr:primosomal protein N' [Hydrogenibacillus sp.]
MDHRQQTSRYTAEVAIDVPYDVSGRYTYAVPPKLSERVAIGSRVLVPFGRRRMEGIVVALHQDSRDIPPSGGWAADRPPFIDIGTPSPTGDDGPVRGGSGELGARKLKFLLDVLDETPPFTEELVDLARDFSEAMLYPLYRTLISMLPPSMKTEERVRIRWNGGDEPLIALPEEVELLEWVKANGPVDKKTLLMRFPDAEPILDLFIERGWLAEERLRTHRGRAKTMKVVVPVHGADILQKAAEAVRGERQKAVLALLAEHGRMPLQALIRATGATSASIRALAQAGWVRVEEASALRRPSVDPSWQKPPVALSDDQRRVVEAIWADIERGDAAPVLLHGVTGSGKTEVYLTLIERMLSNGKTALLLVPEIALTPMMLARVQHRFGDNVAVLHSGLSAGERFDEWQRIRRGEVGVVVGARSAVFAPLERIGLIILDEEHEGSYKQEETPRYHAREVALWRARRHGAALVLGSATPSMESYAYARAGRYRLMVMPKRVGGARLPSVRIVDLRREGGGDRLVSPPLSAAIDERLKRGEQIILLQNRRGYANIVLCRRCGRAVECPHCAVTLTYHRTDEALRCHYCGFEQPMVERCPSCGSTHLLKLGGGTQRVEEALAAEFPAARVIRMDRDTTQRKGAHEDLLGRFMRGEADILIGTQMIAKGLDFPKVTLVGIVSADSMLALPDFRAAERTFQLVTQVAGRAGRGTLPGEVVVQTFAPDHYSIRAAVDGRYEAFFAEELARRKKGSYPPFYRLVVIHAAHAQASLARETLFVISDRLRMRVGEETIVIGPTPAPIPKLRDRFRFHTLIKYKREPRLGALLRAALEDVQREVKRHRIEIAVDFDPQSLM